MGEPSLELTPQTAALAGYPNVSFMVKNRGGGKKRG